MRIAVLSLALCAAIQAVELPSKEPTGDVVEKVEETLEHSDAAPKMARGTATLDELELPSGTSELEDLTSELPTRSTSDQLLDLEILPSDTSDLEGTTSGLPTKGSELLDLETLPLDTAGLPSRSLPEQDLPDLEILPSDTSDVGKLTNGLPTRSTSELQDLKNLPSNTAELEELSDELPTRSTSQLPDTETLPSGAADLKETLEDATGSLSQRGMVEEDKTLTEILDDIEAILEEPTPSKLKIQKILDTIVHHEEVKKRDESSATKAINEIITKINEIVDDTTMPAEKKLKKIMKEMDEVPIKRSTEHEDESEILDDVLEKVEEILDSDEPSKQKIQDILNEIVSHVTGTSSIPEDGELAQRSSEEEPIQELLYEVQSLIMNMTDYDKEMSYDNMTMLNQTLYECEQLIEQILAIVEHTKGGHMEPVKAADPVKSLLEEVEDMLEEIEHELDLPIELEEIVDKLVDEVEKLLGEGGPSVVKSGTA